MRAGEEQSRSGAELRFGQASAGHLAGSARLGVAAHPFCDNFRLTGCRVWPILLSSSLLLHYLGHDAEKGVAGIGGYDSAIGYTVM